MFKNKVNRASRAAKQLAEQQEQPVNKQDYFNNCHRTYSCIHCRAHLANHDELISKLFQGNHGRAYLFNRVVNIGCKQAVQRELLTGLHAVADIYCDNCETTLGWKYEQAFVASQKYKEGKYIIELVHMLKENDWDLTSYNARELLEEAQKSKLSQEYEESNVSKIKAFNKFKNTRSLSLATDGSVDLRSARVMNDRQIETSNDENNQNCRHFTNGEESKQIIISENNNLNALNLAQTNADEIETLSRSINKIQLIVKQEDGEENDMTTSSKNSLSSTTTRSRSDLSSSNGDLPGTSLLLNECGTSGSSSLKLLRTSSNYKLNKTTKLKENNLDNSQRLAMNRPEVELIVTTAGL